MIEEIVPALFYVTFFITVLFFDDIVGVAKGKLLTAVPLLPIRHGFGRGALALIRCLGIMQCAVGAAMPVRVAVLARLVKAGPVQFVPLGATPVARPHRQ